MHDLETSIKRWRETVAASKLNDETLDELENHLRESVDALVRSGLSEQSAFERAVAELGAARGLALEFQKLEACTWLPIRVAIGIAALAVVAASIFLVQQVDAPGIKLLLAMHVVTVTLGYSTTFLIGALGICFVGQRCFSEFPVFRIRSLTRATFLFGSFAFILSAVGVVLAMFWAKAAWGRYWAWDIKETSAVLVLGWQLCFLAAHRFLARKEHRIPVMSILGNVVVGFAWIGAYQLAGVHRYGTPGWSPLLAFLALNLALFFVGFAPAGWLRRNRV